LLFHNAQDFQEELVTRDVFLRNNFCDVVVLRLTTSQAC